MASKTGVTLKLGVSGALLTLVFFEIDTDAGAVLEAMQTGQRWYRLVAATCVIAGALSLSIVRWRYITHTAGIKLTMLQAFRLGSVAVVVSFIGLGVVGGDVIKAVSVARDNPHRRVRAVVSIAADRIVGIFALLLVASFAALALDSGTYGAGLHALTTTVHGITIVAAVAISAFLISARLSTATLSLLDRTMRPNNLLRRIVEAIVFYRGVRGVLFLMLLVSMCIHILSVTGFYLIASSLPPPAPSLSEQFLIAPLALVAGAVPLPFGALGALDYSMSHLSSIVTSGRVDMGQGFLVSMVYRCILAGMAIFGLLFYMATSGTEKGQEPPAHSDASPGMREGSGELTDKAHLRRTP